MGINEIVSSLGGCRVDDAAILGLRVLDGRAEFYLPKGDNYWDSDPLVCAYRVDGEWLAFVEDPQDGYRSDLGEVAKLPASAIPVDCMALFPAMVVEFRTFDGTPPGGYGVDRVFYATAENFEGCVLIVGTSNYDDYYPSSAHSWSPDGSLPIPVTEDTA